MGSTILGIIALLGILCLTASVIAALTPTPSDDKWLGKAYKWTVDLLALNILKAKDKAVSEFMSSEIKKK